MQAEEVIRAVYADFARGDAEAVLARLHPEIEFRLAEHHLEGRYAGEHRETGRALDMQFCHVWRVADGRVLRFQQYTDTAHLSQVTAA